jgi:hypothetical protein
MASEEWDCESRHGALGYNQLSAFDADKMMDHCHHPPVWQRGRGQRGGVAHHRWGDTMGVKVPSDKSWLAGGEGRDGRGDKRIDGKEEIKQCPTGGHPNALLS